MDGGIDNFGTFWGIDLIPVGLDDDIAVIAGDILSKFDAKRIENKRH